MLQNESTRLVLESKQSKASYLVDRTCLLLCSGPVLLEDVPLVEKLGQVRPAVLSVQLVYFESKNKAPNA